MKTTSLAKKNPKKEGAALIVALIFSIIVMSGIAGLLPMLLTDWKMANRTSVQDAAFALAESGIEEAVWALKVYGDDVDNWVNGGWTKSDDGSYLYREWKLASEAFQLDDDQKGSFRVIVEDPSAASVITIAEGTISGGKNVADGLEVKRYIETTLQNGSPLAYGLIAKDTLNFNGQPSFDSYNSTIFPYDYSQLNSGENTVVGSIHVDASKLDLGNAKIYGDLISGATDPGNGLPGYSGNPTITGDTHWEISIALPDVSAPGTAGFKTSF